MSILYKSASGREVRHLSYSAISDYDFCPRLFKLSRIDGYKDKNKKAAFVFGTAVEDAIQFYHANGLKEGDGIDEFKRLWLKFKDIELVFTKQEGSWQELYFMGADMLRLYEIFLPTLPIRNPKFQLNYAKPLWPGSDLADLEFTSYIDLLSTLENGQRIIVDIKTAKNPLDDANGMVALDPQLKDYAWASGIRDVAFLWLIKAQSSMKKGDSVTLLATQGDWKAGTPLEIVGEIEPKEGDERVYFNVGTPETVRIMDEERSQISGKGSKEKKEQVYQKYSLASLINTVDKECLTKVRLQWVQGVIPEEDLPEAGQQIGHKMIQIKTAAENNFFPKTGGLRFPNVKCPSCRMRGICLGRKDLIDKLLVQTKPAKPEEETDWLTELENGGDE